jgi:RNA polymerase-binding transcription factor DksA
VSILNPQLAIRNSQSGARFASFAISHVDRGTTRQSGCRNVRQSGTSILRGQRIRPMNKTSLSKYRRLLTALADRVGADAATMRDQVRAGTSGHGGTDLSNAPFHLGEMGTDEFLYDMNATLLENEQYIVSEARAALDRMDNGTYGTCQSCLKKIPAARLEAIPYTRFCVECAAVEDVPEANFDKGRPRRPEDTLAPEGEMKEDRTRSLDELESQRPSVRRDDVHAAGTAGGGTAVGGLAGSNEGDGDPTISEIDEATGSGNFDIEDDRPDDNTPMSGFTGGAVGGTPARKRAK